MAETYSGIDLEVHNRCGIISLIILIIIRLESITRLINTPATLLYGVCHEDHMNYMCTA